MMTLKQIAHECTLKVVAVNMASKICLFEGLFMGGLLFLMSFAVPAHHGIPQLVAFSSGAWMGGALLHWFVVRKILVRRLFELREDALREAQAKK